MASEFPKLQAKLDEILSEFNKILEAKIENGDIESVKLSISVENFVPRSVKANLPISSKQHEVIKSEIDGKTVTVSVVDEKQRIISYKGNRYSCGSKETQRNGDILYRNCTII